MKSAIAGVVLCASLLFSQSQPPVENISAWVERARRELKDTTKLSSVRTVFIEKMPNSLDVYLMAEFGKQFNGDITVVGKKEAADAVVTEIYDHKLAMAFRGGGNLYAGGVAPTVSILPQERQIAADYVRSIKALRTSQLAFSR